MKRLLGLLMMLGVLMVGVLSGCGDKEENPASSKDYGCDVTSNKDECVGCGYDELKAVAASSLSSTCKSSLKYYEALQID